MFGWISVFGPLVGLGWRTCAAEAPLRWAAEGAARTSDPRSLPFPSSRSEIRLGRSESLKGREELKRSRKTENVPRSRSDVDMDAAAEAARLHQSASSSASSLSTRCAGSVLSPLVRQGQGQRV